MSKNNDVDNVVIPNIIPLKENTEKIANIVKKSSLSQRSSKVKPVTEIVKDPVVPVKKISKPKPSTFIGAMPIGTKVPLKETTKTDHKQIVKTLRDITREQTTFIVQQNENYEFNRTNLLPIVHQFKEMLKSAHSVMEETNIKLTNIINELNKE
jgi:hypothetical protein